MADQHGAHQTDEAYVVSLCEDFCKSPTAPVGYMISQKLDMSTLVCGTVNGCGTPVLNMSSRITNVTGNEAGVGGGVVSGVNIGMCKPAQEYAPKVRAEGQCVLRHDTIMDMNIAGPEGTSNTKGKIVYLSKGASYNDSKSSDTDSRIKKKKKLGEVTSNGKTVEIWEVSGLAGGGQYSIIGPDKAEIYLSESDWLRKRDGWTEANKANEVDTFQRDAADGTLDGKCLGDNGEELSHYQAEAKSDEASIKVLDEQIRNGCDGQLDSPGCFFGLRTPNSQARAERAYYQKRKAALEKAHELSQKGDIKGANEALEGFPGYQQ